MGTEDNPEFLAAALACAIDSKAKEEEDGAVYEVTQTALRSGFLVWRRPGVSTSAVTLSPTCGTLSPTNGRGRAATRANAKQIMVEKPTHEARMIAITMNKMKARCVPSQISTSRRSFGKPAAEENRALRKTPWQTCLAPGNRTTF